MKQVKKWLVSGTFLLIGLGVLFHYIYDWFSYSWVGIFSPVNESIWEHLKIVFWPYLLYTFFEYRKLGPQISNYLLSKVIGIYFGLLSIIVLHYTIVGAFGKQLFIIDLIIFILSILITQMMSYRMMKSKKYNVPEVFSFMLFGLLILCFVVFTFTPPILPLFEDPQTNTYGIQP